MNKKILGAAVTVIFCICLIVTSNIRESDDTVAVEISREVTVTHKTAVTEKNEAVNAGVSLVLSKYSFTTESDEKPCIERNETEVVTAPEEIEQEIDSNRWNIKLSEEEIDLLAKIVWLEASGESELGQQAVVEVVFNRMASEKYPNTLYDVLSQKNPVQFCSWKNRSIAKPTEKEYQSIYQVLEGNTNILRNDTLYFSTVALTPNLDTRIGGHSFCY